MGETLADGGAGPGEEGEGGWGWGGGDEEATLDSFFGGTIVTSKSDDDNSIVEWVKCKVQVGTNKYSLVRVRE